MAELSDHVRELRLNLDRLNGIVERVEGQDELHSAAAVLGSQSGKIGRFTDSYGDLQKKLQEDDRDEDEGEREEEEREEEEEEREQEESEEEQREAEEEEREEEEFEEGLYHQAAVDRDLYAQYELAKK